MKTNCNNGKKHDWWQRPWRLLDRSGRTFLLHIQPIICTWHQSCRFEIEICKRVTPSSAVCVELRSLHRQHSSDSSYLITRTRCSPLQPVLNEYWFIANNKIRKNMTMRSNSIMEMPSSIACHIFAHCRPQWHHQYDISKYHSISQPLTFNQFYSCLHAKKPNNGIVI